MRLYTSSAQKYLHCLLVFYLFYILSTCVPVPLSHCPNSTCFHLLSAFISFCFFPYAPSSFYFLPFFAFLFIQSPYGAPMKSLAQLNIDYSVLNLKYRSFLLPVVYRFLFMHWTISVVYHFFSMCWNTFQKPFSCHIAYDLSQILQQSI